MTRRRFEVGGAGVLDVTVPDPEGALVSGADFRVEEEHPREGAVVLAVYGDVDLHSADQLADRLGAAIDRRPSSLVVDLSGVTFVDSQGIGALLRGTRRFEGNEGRFRLVVPSSDIRRVFEITALDRVFALARTREEALAPGADEAPPRDA